MATVYEERLGRPDDAIAAYRGVLELEPTSMVAVSYTHLTLPTSDLV